MTKNNSTLQQERCNIMYIHILRSIIYKIGIDRRRVAVATGAWVKTKHDMCLTRGSVGA